MRFLKFVVLATCLVVNILYLFYLWELSIFTVTVSFFAFYLSFVVHGALHEVGHYVGGKLSGYKLVVLQIGRCNIICNRKGKVAFSFRKTRGGQCIMLPFEKVPVRYFAYNAGGVIFNVVAVLASVTLLLLNTQLSTLIFIEFAFSGGYKVVTNLFPCIRKGIPTDGYVLKVLKKNALVQRDYAKYLSLYAALFWEEKVRAKDYKYEREAVKCDSELLYYNAIQELLSDLV